MDTLRKALANDKPSTAVTDWIERLCSERYQEDDYEGIPDLVESINLQSTGPTEASRAIRKKLKYGSIHRQLRSLTILKALVENCGPRFQTTFANERLLERIKIMSGDPLTDVSVKKKLMTVIASWHRQFKDDPKMHIVTSLYTSLKPSQPNSTAAYQEEQKRLEEAAQLRRQRKETEWEQARQREKEAKKAKERTKRQQNSKVKRPPFNFEKEKPQIMQSVANVTQSANGLINALQHVNREKESVAENSQVQDYLNKTKTGRKAVVRFIQLVETDPTGDYIGTLISTNELAVNALQLYDRMSKPPEHDSDDDTNQTTQALADFDLDGEVDKIQDRQRVEIERVKNHRMNPHPDLQDLDFNATESDLPPPIQPGRLDDDDYQRGNLSDYSDYSSSDEATHNALASTSKFHAYYNRTADEEGGRGLLTPRADDVDPFADPEEDGVATPGIVERKRMEWAEI